jgi:DNA gyrase/topoisomerase IV subunit A
MTPIPPDLQAMLEEASADVATMTKEANNLTTEIARLEAALKSAKTRLDVIRPSWSRDRGALVTARERLAAVEREVSDHERVKVAGWVVVAAGPKRVTVRKAGAGYTRTMDRGDRRPWWADGPLPADETEAAIADYEARRRAGKVTA